LVHGTHFIKFNNIDIIHEVFYAIIKDTSGLNIMFISYTTSFINLINVFFNS
jgi:hypothetical protein